MRFIYEKNKENLLQQQKNNYVHFKELVRTNAEIEKVVNCPWTIQIYVCEANCRRSLHVFSRAYSNLNCLYQSCKYHNTPNYY